MPCVSAAPIPCTERSHPPRAGEGPGVGAGAAPSRAEAFLRVLRCASRRYLSGAGRWVTLPANARRGRRFQEGARSPAARRRGGGPRQGSSPAGARADRTPGLGRADTVQKGRPRAGSLHRGWDPGHHEGRSVRARPDASEAAAARGHPARHSGGEAREALSDGLAARRRLIHEAGMLHRWLRACSILGPLLGLAFACGGDDNGGGAPPQIASASAQPARRTQTACKAVTVESCSTVSRSSKAVTAASRGARRTSTVRRGPPVSSTTMARTTASGSASTKRSAT